MSTNAKEIDQLVNQTYEAGFYTDIEQEFAPPGLNEGTIVILIFPFVDEKISDLLVLIVIQILSPLSNEFLSK